MTKHVQGLCLDADGAPIRTGTHHAGARAILNHALNGGFNVIALDDFIGDEFALGRVGIEQFVKHDGLAGQPLTKKARQSDVGRTRKNAFFPGRQAEIGSLFSDHIVHHQEQLTPATNGEGFNHGHPGLFVGSFRLIERVIQTIFFLAGEDSSIEFVVQCQASKEERHETLFALIDAR